MRVDLITVAYGLPDDTKALVEKVLEESAHDVKVHLFLHSKYPEVVKVCKALAKNKAVKLYDYGVNRGLGKSLNEGLLAAYGGGADVAIVANDDLLPDDGAFDLLAELAMENQDFYKVYGRMFVKRTGKEDDSRLNFCAINPIALETIGMFDENLFPIYYDDVDWEYRARLAGLPDVVSYDVHGVHLGSASIYSVPGLKEQNGTTFYQNRAYYKRKWGGDMGRETFSVPFNDNKFDVRIDPKVRSAPYPGYNRTDQDIVRI